MTKPMSVFDVFLSYNRSDERAVMTLARRLEDEENLRPWLDQWKLVPGEPWPDAIDQALSVSRTCAVFLGPEGIGPWENEELRAALRMRTDQKDFRVIPVLLPGASLPEMGKLPLFLSSLTWVDFRSGLNNEAAFQDLVAGIRGIERGRRDEQAASSPVMECPYRGLEVFEESHAKYFFGREAMTQQIIEALLHHRFIAVLGPSGSGKSSLVRAGVIPKLKGGGLTGSENWAYITVTPGVHPLDELALSLVGLDRDSDLLEQTRRLLDHLRSDERALHLHIRLHLSGKAKNTFLFLFIDRFEEIMTLCKDDNERSQFLLNLRYAATIGDGQIITVITMRADFLELAAAHRNLTEMLSGHQIFLSRMDDQNLRKAIEEPAKLVGLRFEKGLVERMLDEVGHEPGALPLLQDALMQLYENRSAENVALLREYQELGGVDGALAKRAEEVFGRFSADEQEIAQRVLLALTEPGEDVEDTRRRAELNELWPVSTDRPGVETVVEQMVVARLLTMSRDQRAVRMVEVAHEALIRGWPRLRQWIDEKRGALRLHRQITRSAQQWRDRHRDAGFLYRGVRLAEALEWKNENGSLMNELEREFLETSSVVQSQESRATRRRRWVTVIISAVTLALIVLAYIAYQKQRQAAMVTELVNNSKQVPDPELGVWMALEAVRLSPTADAESALRQALTNLQESVVLRGHTGKVYTAVFSPDGEKVVTASEDGTAQIWDARTGRPLLEKPLSHTEEVYSAAFSPDGKSVVTASKDNTAQLWDAQTGQPLFTLSHDGEVNSANFSPDGQYVVTTSDDKAVKIWKVKTGKLLFDPLLAHEHKVYRAVFSPNGDRLLTASEDKTARIWDLTSGRLLFTLRLHTKAVIRIDFSPDGKYVITGSKDNTAQIWDAHTGQPLFNELLKQDDQAVNTAHTVNGVAFNPNPKSLQAVTVSSDHSGRIWDAKTGKVVQMLRGHLNKIHSVAYSKDGEQIVTTSSDRTARIWDAHTGDLVSELRGHSGVVWTAAFSKDGKHVATASLDHTARIWDTHTGRPLFEEAPSAVRHTGTVNCVAYNPDGDEIITASADHTARIWDARTGQPSLKEPLRHKGEVYSAAYSEDGKQVVTASADHTARIWDAHTGQPLKEPLPHSGEVYSAAFSPDGTQVVTTSGPTEGQPPKGQPEHTAQIWDVRTGKLLSVLRGHHAKIYGAVFTRDGKQVATVSADADAPVRIWDVQTGRQSSLVLHQSLDVYSVAFNKTGNRLVTANRDKTARVWDAQTGQLIWELGHDDQVRSASFSPDGKQVVTASLDKTARIWDVYTGQLLLELRGHSDKVYSAAFSPDGKQVATAGVDKIVRIYACEECGPMEELIRLAHSRNLRPLKDEERMTYLHHR